MEKTKGHTSFEIRLADIYRQARGRVVMTSFLSPAEQGRVEETVPRQLFLQFDGGYPLAERKVAVVSPWLLDVSAGEYESNDWKIENWEFSGNDYEYQDFTDTWSGCAGASAAASDLSDAAASTDGLNHPGSVSDVVCLVSSVDERFGKLAHPDVLGALMNIGLEREQFGDIVIEDSKVYVFAKAAIADYVCQMVTKIRKVPVSFAVSELRPLSGNAREELTVSAASERADAITAALGHMSRAKAIESIRAGFVKVNDEVLSDSRILKENDIISIRRCGRFLYKGIASTSRKGKLRLLFDKYS